MDFNAVKLQAITAPQGFSNVPPVPLSDATIQARKDKVLAGMHAEGFDALVIYADKEHGSNFEYLTGFIPRFEEGLLILEKSGAASVILGNENLKMAAHSRIPVTLKHSPYFSLPNQPMENVKPLEVLFGEIGLQRMPKIGLVGWKMFTSAARRISGSLIYPLLLLTPSATAFRRRPFLKTRRIFSSAGITARASPIPPTKSPIMSTVRILLQPACLTR